MKEALIISPSPVKLSFLQEILQGAEYRVTLSSHTEEAILKAARSSFTVILLDSQSEPMNPFQTLRFLRSLPLEEPPVLVLLTADEESAVRFWARESGAHLVQPLKEESLKGLPRRLEELPASTETQPAMREMTELPAENREDRLTAKNLLKAVSSVNDRELFQLWTAKSLYQAGETLDSLEKTAQRVLEALTRLAEIPLGVLILPFQRQPVIFALPAPYVYRREADEFIQLCREDFLRRPEAEGLRPPREIILGMKNRSNFDKVRIDGRRLSSYQAEELRNSSGELIGTLHAGNFKNNYFSGHIPDRISRFAREAALILHNTVQYNEMATTRSRIEQIFSKFVPREVIQDLLGQSDDAELQLGEKRHLAILFSDIRAFTVISEHNSAENIVTFLNNYFDRMSRAIRGQGGFIDKFIGDAILAVFGAPISYEDNAARAVRAALEMEEALKELDTSRLELPEGGFDIGIGVHEGQVIVGNIGSRDKFDYTIIGDNVNLASRLESLTKHYHQKIMVSDVLAQSLEDDYFLRQVDRVKVKGKSEATTLYSVHRQPEIPQEAMKDYNKGLQMEKLGNWNLGCEYFNKVLRDHPRDFLSRLHHDRCRDYTENPPEQWDGALKLDFK